MLFNGASLRIIAFKGCRLFAEHKYIFFGNKGTWALDNTSQLFPRFQQKLNFGCEREMYFSFQTEGTFTVESSAGFFYDMQEVRASSYNYNLLEFLLLLLKLIILSIIYLSLSFRYGSTRVEKTKSH